MNPYPVSNILVPTDFSEASLKAAHYASKLAQLFNARIILFHAIGLPIVTSAEEAELISAGELEKIEHEQLLQIRQNFKRLYPALTIEAASATGFPVEQIREYTGKNKIDIIVMGTRGASGFKEIIVGSNTASLISQTECPVLAIPENAEFKGMRNIVFATNMLKDDINSLKKIIHLFGKENPKITILHIEDGHRRDPEAALLNWFREDISKEISYSNLHAESISETNIVKTLHDYLISNKVDLLVTATRKRNFIERIFDRSITQRLVFHTDVPLLALHSHGSKGEIIL